MTASQARFFFQAAKYGGITCGWWFVANAPTTGSPSVFLQPEKRTPVPNLYRYLGIFSTGVNQL
jgi:hypothetical protein